MFNLDLPYLELAHNFGAAFHWGVLFVVVIAFFYFLHKGSAIETVSKLNTHQLVLSILIGIPVVLLLAFFPIEWGTYADREGYLYIFNHFDDANFDDYAWFIIYKIIKFFSSEQLFFFGVLAFIYVALRYLACLHISKENNLLVFLMVISSFLFFSYGHNTIRAGIASSMLILGFSLFFKNRYGLILSLTLMLMSIGVHKSMFIPIIAFLISFFYRNTKVLIVLWIISFFLSYLFGNLVSDYLGALVTENAGKQAGGYITNAEDSIYQTGFRIDFILYSLAPIVVGGYYILKKKFNDKLYATLYGTYIISNIFFILVIRASFIDRFGYLSWMLMPFILSFLRLFEAISEITPTAIPASTAPPMIR